jgi:hypothetical protein
LNTSALKEICKANTQTLLGRKRKKRKQKKKPYIEIKPDIRERGEDPV